MSDRDLANEISLLRMDVANLTQGLMAMTETIAVLIKMMTSIHKAVSPLPPEDEQ